MPSTIDRVNKDLRLVYVSSLRMKDHFLVRTCTQNAETGEESMHDPQGHPTLSFHERAHGWNLDETLSESTMK